MSDRASKRTHENKQAGDTGIHPIVFKIVVGAMLWFLVVVWIAFGGKGEVDLDLAIVTLFCGIFVTLFLLVASFTVGDPRWPTRQTSLREFLHGTVGTATGDERGRDVLIEIALLPVVLAFAATLIGLAWMIFR